MHLWMDFHQTCIDTLLGEKKEYKMLMALTLFFMVTQVLAISNFDQN